MLKPLKRLMLVAVITDFNMCKSSDIRWQRPQRKLVIEHFFVQAPYGEQAYFQDHRGNDKRLHKEGRQKRSKTTFP